MKLAILTWVFLGFLTASAIEEIPQKDDSRTTAQILKDNKVSDKDLCEVACQSKFSRCYNKNKKAGFKCAAKTVTCNNKCK